MSLLKTLTSLVFLFILLDSIQLCHGQADIVSDKDPNNFYRIIIENNLFRPLGWRPKKAIFPYQLIGTIIYTSGKQEATAIIQETTAEKKTYVLTIDETLGDMTVIDIQNKQVTLDKTGKKITLNLTLQFLNLPSLVWKPTSNSTTQPDKKPSKIDKKTSKQAIKLSDLPKINWNGKTIYWNPSDFSRAEIEQKLRDQDF